MINVAIIEDHQVLVDALRLLILKEDDFSFVGAAETLAAGRELAKHTRPDVLLLDVNLPDGSGLDIIEEVKGASPDTQVVVLTRLTDENTLLRAVDSGASGFLSKSCSLTELMATVRQAASGEIVMPSSLLYGLLTRVTREKAVAYRADKGWEPLTPREHEVLGHLAKGSSVPDISETLHIAPLTVRTHIRNLMAKLDVHSRLEAVSFALRNGLIDPPA
ncbi:MAG: response regulator transcription factor [Anaerolineales bacterium]|jgi:DNA-binding NarL/FixJ family response regulator